MTNTFVWQSNQESHLYGERHLAPIRRNFEQAGLATVGDMEHVLNVRPDPVDFRDRYFEPTLIEVTAFKSPIMTTSRALGSRSLVVRDQGPEGSCTAQALAAVIDIQNARRRLEGADVPARVSARMLYEKARQHDEFTDDGEPGSSLRGCLKGFWHHGVCDSRLAPYRPVDINWRLTAEMSIDARRVNLGAYMRLRHVLNDYHVAILEAGAIYCAAMIHRNWEAPSVQNENARHAARGRIIYDPEIDHAHLKGAHAFAIVGYTPEGFLVLNSWGSKWGNYNPRRAMRRYLDKQLSELAITKAHWEAAWETVCREFADEDLPGIALWSYADWQANVIDAWVLRLSAPTRSPAGTVGGFMGRFGKPEKALGEAELGASTREREVVGHLIHVRNGALVDRAPRYATPPHQFEETIRRLSQSQNDPDRKYQHILFYAHGGLNDLDDAVARAAALTKTMKRNKIYPLFYCWRTGVTETIEDVVLRKINPILARTRGMEAITDGALELALGSVGSALWNEMKLDAFRLFSERPSLGQVTKSPLPGGVAELIAHSGAAWDATLMFMTSNLDVRYHFVGHSAGAIALGYFFHRLRKDAPKLLDKIATITLFAPACTTGFFDGAFGPTIQTFGQTKDAAGRNRFTVYNLPDALERSTDPFIKVYSKSLLWLVSNAFERPKKTEIAGINEHWEAKLAPKYGAVVDYIVSGARLNRATKPANARSMARHHGSFDNDPLTMNTLLSRVLDRPLAKPINELNGGYTYPDIGDEAAF